MYGRPASGLKCSEKGRRQATRRVAAQTTPRPRITVPRASSNDWIKCRRPSTAFQRRRLHLPEASRSGSDAADAIPPSFSIALDESPPASSASNFDLIFRGPASGLMGRTLRRRLR
ncbi:hypothetical protein DFH06DRAFT_1119573 [Mycena polygramma]|nr:hypothetical protein DFH06DRAFT_1119573 [Mycena polygramma]